MLGRVHYSIVAITLAWYPSAQQRPIGSISSTRERSFIPRR